ncbi:MAG: hypothetical protein WC707_05230 [Candidatus Babeliaceae bacterium]|jgi:hypothetical protein
MKKNILKILSIILLISQFSSTALLARNPIPYNRLLPFLKNAFISAKNRLAMLKAETIFFKTDGSVISDDEHKKIYDIKLHNQFPTSLNYNNFQEDEIAAMQNALDTQVPGVKVQFIPTSLYEMFVFHFLNPHLNNTNIESKTGGALYNVTSFKNRLLAKFNQRDTEAHSSEKSLNLNSPLYNLFGNADGKIKLPFDLINNHSSLIDFHKIINRHIVAHLTANNIQPAQLNFDACRSIVNDQFQGQATEVFSSLSGYNRSIHSDIIESIKQEYIAHNNNTFLLYRGTVAVENYRPDENAALSFGTSWFAGLFFDNHKNGHSSAVAYSHHLYKGSNGYVLPISKKEYVHGPLGNQFHIPPLSTLAGLFGRGEYFHPRSKILSSQFVRGFAGAKEPLPEYIIKTEGFFASNKAHKLYRQIFQYIQDHNIPIHELAQRKKINSDNRAEATDELAYFS